MDSVSLVAMASIIGAGLAMGIGSIGPGLGMGQAIAQALAAIAQQPDERNSLNKNAFCRIGHD